MKKMANIISPQTLTLTWLHLPTHNYSSGMVPPYHHTKAVKLEYAFSCNDGTTIVIAQECMVTTLRAPDSCTSFLVG